MKREAERYRFEGEIGCILRENDEKKSGVEWVGVTMGLVGTKS